MFRFALGERKNFTAVALISRFTVEPGALVDSRTGARYAVGGSVLLYVVASRSLRRLELKDLPEYIRRLQVAKRHWIQVVEIEWLRD